MPVCAVNATQKLPCLAISSATIAEHTLSISRPPYSSGISTESSPRSPASFISRRVTEKSFASIASLTGTTSFRANSAVVCAICLCSSEKSSGKKQSAGVASEIRKLPPGMIFFVAGEGVVLVAMVLPLGRCLVDRAESMTVPNAHPGHRMLYSSHSMTLWSKRCGGLT